MPFKTHIFVDEKKAYLMERLRQEHCLWSYDMDSVGSIPDDLLIELTLIHLDIDDINLLFDAYPYQSVKKVWLQNLVAQGERYYTLNKFLAWYYFHAKRPRMYVHSMETRILNKRLAL